MKELTIIVYDYALNNFNLELNHYFAHNLEMFEEIEQNLEIIIIAPNKDKYEFNPHYLEHIDVRTNNEDLKSTLKTVQSKYTLLMDSQDVFVMDLNSILDAIRRQTADLVFTQLEYNANKNIEFKNNKSAHNIFGLENYKTIGEDKWLLNLKGLIIKTDYLKSIEHLNIINAINSRLIYNQLLLNDPKIEYYQKALVSGRITIPTELELDEKFKMILKEYEQLISSYYQNLPKSLIKIFAKQLVNDLTYVHKLLQLNPKIHGKKYRKSLRKFSDNHQNELTKQLAIGERISLIKIYQKQKDGKKIRQKYFSVIQILFKQLPKKKNKIVVLNKDDKFKGELKYYTRNLIKENPNYQIYFKTKQKIKGLNPIKSEFGLMYYYHLHTAEEIVYFDMISDRFKKSDVQIVNEVFNDISSLTYPFIQYNYDLLNSSYQVKGAKQHLENVNELICPNKYVMNKLVDVVENKLQVQRLYSEQFLVDNIQNYELIANLKKKYKLQMSKSYILYPILDLPYQQYIDVKEINEKLKENEVLILVPLTSAYSLVNIHRQGYVLCDGNVDLIEIALLCEGIVNNGNTLLDIYRNSYRKIIEINYDMYLMEEMVGQI